MTTALCLMLGQLVAVALVQRRGRPLPPRASEDDLMLHSMQQDWRERLVQ